MKLEKLVDEALKNRNLQVLDAFLQEDIHEEATLKCSKQFLTKLDKLVTRVRYDAVLQLVCHCSVLFGNGKINVSLQFM